MKKEKKPLKDKIWQVQERQGRQVVSGQTRYVRAATRKEAKEFYAIHYKRFTCTTMTATVISDDAREWDYIPHIDYFSRP